MEDFTISDRQIEDILIIPNLPKVIMFYGPPGSGKGTQASLLQTRLNIPFLDWGYEFRNFVQKNSNQKDSPDHLRARRVQQYMQEGLPILTEDLQYIIGQAIVDGCTGDNHGFVMDKCGVKIEEAEWLSNFLKNKNIPSILFHLPLTMEEAVERITNRYYVPGDKKPYRTYEQALENCPEGVLPLKRADENKNTTMARYDNLYRLHHDQILKAYSEKEHTKIVDIDAEMTIHEVHDNVIIALQDYARELDVKSLTKI